MTHDYEAWRCPSRDQFPDGPSVFCPIDGCPERIWDAEIMKWIPAGCARDLGWLPVPGAEYPVNLARFASLVDD